MPTYERLVEALGQLLDAYEDVEIMLDVWASFGPECETKEEKKKHRAANKVRDAAQKLHLQATTKQND